MDLRVCQVSQLLNHFKSHSLATKYAHNICRRVEPIPSIYDGEEDEDIIYSCLGSKLACRLPNPIAKDVRSKTKILHRCCSTNPI
mmetsp:Transcript_19297/g.43640  ORF Transcript_19297/g.43640 Transcript_19297/m.43640 type:complete len:85 (+) Transcript_19297:258-512(+)